MKTIIRNFISVLRRYKMATALNVLGLSVAFAAFMVIMMQVDYERTFDRCHPDVERIFRVDLDRGNGEEPMPILARAMIDALVSSSPHIEEGTLLNPFAGNIYVTVGDSLGRKGFHEKFATCYPNITRVFGFEFTEGDAACLNDPEKVIIPLSAARRMFGEAPATGQSIEAMENVWTKFGTRKYTVGGVYKDFPSNTQLDNSIYTAMDKTMLGDWTSPNFFCYLLLDSKAGASQFTEDMNRSFDFSPAPRSGEFRLHFRLMPLRDIYYSHYTMSTIKTGDATAMRILFSIALLVIVLAAINFTNFSVALAPVRMRSINTRKILGSTAGALRWALASEAVLVAGMSWLLSLVIVSFLGSYRLLSFIDAETDLIHALPLALLTGGIALFTGLVAGLYPAWYTTSFQPALVLKGSFALSPAGRFLRTGLVGFQYIISIGLITGAVFIQLQNKYMKGYGQGFDKDHIALVQISGDMYRQNKDALVNKLEEYPGIEGVAFARQKIGGTDTYSQYKFTYLEQEFYAHTLEVSSNFLDVMDISVSEGRNFLPSEEHAGGKPSLIFNKLLQERVQVGVGHAVDMGGWDIPNCPVVGIVDGVKITSARQKDYPLAFLINSPIPFTLSYIRLKGGADVREAVKHIRQTVASIDPAYPVEVEFYDEVFNRLYQKEENLNKSITLLSVLAIIISIVGVFGLVLFETEYRKKEISIRKVHGASVANILAMFNKVYFRIVCACFILATPAAWYAVTKWLENFAYKTPLHWWVFALSFATVALITAATVTIQNWRTANMNPAENIKRN